MGSTARSLVLAGSAWCLAATQAQAQQEAGTTREQCLDSHEQAQAERLSGRLLKARDALRRCSAATCPALVTRDCVGWLAEVEQLIPSVIFQAVKDGDDVESLSVREGSEVLTQRLTGRALQLDPGPHHFVAELPGFPPREATYVLQAGDKRRVVSFEFQTPKNPPRPSPARKPAPAPSGAPVRTHEVPTASYLFAGTALVAVAAGGVLGGLALAKRNQLDERCAPLCSEQDVQGLRRLGLAADVSFIVALLSAGAAGYVYATRPSLAARTPLPHAALRVRLAPGAFGLQADGDF